MVVVKLVMGRSGEERVLKGVVVEVLGVRYLDMDIGEEYVLRAEGMALHRKQSIVAD